MELSWKKLILKAADKISGPIDNMRTTIIGKVKEHEAAHGSSPTYLYLTRRQMDALGAMANPPIPPGSLMSGVTVMGLKVVQANKFAVS